jgi:hypothetical protein
MLQRAHERSFAAAWIVDGPRGHLTQGQRGALGDSDWPPPGSESSGPAAGRQPENVHCVVRCALKCLGLVATDVDLSSRGRPHLLLREKLGS